MTNVRSIVKNVFLSVPFLLFAGVTVADALFYVAGHVPEVVRLLRDGVLLLALIILLPLQQRFSIFSERRIFPVLRSVFVLVIVAFGILFLVDEFFPPIISSSTGYSLLHTSARHFIVGTVAAISLVLVMLLVMGLLRILVLYKSKRASLRNFRLLSIAILLFAAVASIYGHSSFFEREPFDLSLLMNVTVGLLILLILLNSLRTSWMHFLNRMQKWGMFFMAVIASVLGASIVSTIDDSFVMHYSVAYAAIGKSSALFFSVYSGFSALLLLLHLPTARIYDERINALRIMQELTKSISHFMDKDELNSLVTQRAAAVTNSEFAWLAIVKETEPQQLALGSSCNLTDDEIATIPLRLTNGTHAWVVANRREVFCNNVSNQEELESLHQWKRDLGAFIAVPLMTRDQIFGVLCTARKEIFCYDHFDQELLQGLADQAAIAFQNRRLLADSIERERLAQELRVAHEAQEKLLPKHMPFIHGIQVAGVSIAAHEVGGDYYDVFEVNGKLAVVVGDVSGKGTAAAFYMAEVKGVIEALGQIYNSPREIMIQANRILCRGLDKNLFVSLIFAVFDSEQQLLTLSRAGHTPVVWCPKSGHPALLEPKGLGIGLDRTELFDNTIEQLQLPLHAGDNFVFYTDGVIEARDDHDVEFDEQRLVEVIGENRSASAPELKHRIIERINAHVGTGAAHDDFTLVVVGIDRDGRLSKD